MDKATRLWDDYRRTRSPEAREQIILAYVHLAKYAVDRLNIPSTAMVSRDDLISCALMGLIDAVDRFDPDRGVRFESFAQPRVRGAVVDMLRSLDWAPRSVRKHEDEVRSATQRAEQRLGRSATKPEVADELGVSADDLQSIILNIGQAAVYSLDDTLRGNSDGEGSFSLVEAIAADDDPEADIVKMDEKACLVRAIDKLPERDRLVVSLYYYEELTLKEIGRVLKVTEARACQLHARAVTRLRRLLADTGPALKVG